MLKLVKNYKYTEAKIYIKGCNEPIILKNDELKIEKESNTKQFTLTNSTNKLMIYEDCLAAILLSS